MAQDAPYASLRYRWYIFWILACGYALVYFHRLCPAVVALDMMRDLQASGTLVGFLGAAYFYPYAVMQLPAGLLSDSWGPRKTITMFSGIAFIGSALMGVAPNAFWAIVGRTLVGVGISMIFVPTLKVLAEWFRIREFATMTGILMAMGGVGSLGAAAPLAYLSDSIGWRASFVLVGAVTLVLAALVWVVVRDRPEDKGWPSLVETTTTTVKSIPLMEGMKRVWTTAAFWPLAIWFICMGAIFFTFAGLWGGPYFMQIYGLTRAEAGRILSLSAVGMIIGSPGLSYLSNRVFKGRKPVLVLSSVILLVTTFPLYFFTDTLPIPVLYVMCLSLGIFGGAIVVIAFTANKELFPVQMAGTATGIVNLFPFAGGAIFQPLLGHVLESSGKIEGAFTMQGYKNAFFVLLLCSIIQCVTSFFVKETLAKQQ